MRISSSVVRAAALLLLGRGPLPPLHPHASTDDLQKDCDFGWLEKRMLPLGFHLVLLTRLAEFFTAAREERLKVSGNPRQYDHLDKFVEDQSLLRHLVSESALPRLELDISDNDIPAAVDSIADWMETAGGLYMTS